MDIGDWAATRDLNDIYRDIRALGLETNLAELEAFGFTVIEGALAKDDVKALRETILAIAEDRMGRKIDLENEEDHREVALIPYLLFKDPIFKRAVLNQKQLALITYLLGKHCVLSSLTCHLKGPGGGGLLLHSDTGNNIPDPFSAYSHVANTNYALTDYTEEGGCLAMVPGSHRLHRQPTRAARSPWTVPSATPTPFRWRSRPARPSSGTATPGMAPSLARRPGCGSISPPISAANTSCRRRLIAAMCPRVSSNRARSG